VKDQAGTDQVSGPAVLGTEYLHSTAMFPLDLTVSWTRPPAAVILRARAVRKVWPRGERSRDIRASASHLLTR